MNLQEVFLRSGESVGFTLIELLLAVSLVAIIGVFMFPVGISFHRSQMLSETTSGVETALRKAQNFAMTGKNETSYGVKILDDSYIIFEGDTFDSRVTSEDEVYRKSASVDSSGADEVVFHELTGLPDPSAVVVFAVGGKENSLFIDTLGYVSR